MEKCVIKPQIHRSHPSFREVMERDRFIALWGFLHLVNQTDEAVDKSDNDSHQEPPRHQAVHTRQAGQMGHQELPAMRGQDRLHSRRRNLHGPGQGPPLAPPWISRQCCLPSRGELAGHQQEPHAVHGLLLQRTNWESWPRAPSCQATSTTQGTRQEADRTWLIRIPVPGSSVCHCLVGQQAHPLLEQLPQPCSTVNRSVGERLTQLTAPQLVVDYTR